MVLCMVKTPTWPVDAFRKLLDRILEETDMSQAQLAALVPMDQSQLSRWKSGSSKPRPESLVALGLALRARYPALKLGPDEVMAVVYPGASTVAETPAVPREAERFAMEQADLIRALMREELRAELEPVHEELRRLREERRHPGENRNDENKAG